MRNVIVATLLLSVTLSSTSFAAASATTQSVSSSATSAKPAKPVLNKADCELPAAR